MFLRFYYSYGLGFIWGKTRGELVQYPIVRRGQEYYVDEIFRTITLPIEFGFNLNPFRKFGFGWTIKFNLNIKDPMLIFGSEIKFGHVRNSLKNQSFKL